MPILRACISAHSVFALQEFCIAPLRAPVCAKTHACFIRLAMSADSSRPLQRQPSESILDQLAAMSTVPAPAPDGENVAVINDDPIADTLLDEESQTMDHSVTPTDLETIEDTEVQEESLSDKGSQASSWGDDFWELVGGRPLAAPPKESMDESYDSQLTPPKEAMDEPYDSPAASAGPVVEDHWSHLENFKVAVNGVLSTSHKWPWLRHVLFRDQNFLPDYQMSIDFAAEFIRVHVVGDCCHFKIGITEHPWQRWHREDCGYAMSGWRCMDLLYVAPISKWRINEKWDSAKVKSLKATSTGSMERKLIAMFRDHPGCINTQPGGESASNGSPHFVYVVSRDDPL